MRKPTQLTIRAQKGVRFHLPRTGGAPPVLITDEADVVVPNSAFVRRRIACGDAVEKDGHYHDARSAVSAPAAEQPTAPAKASAAVNMRAKTKPATKGE